MNYRNLLWALPLAGTVACGAFSGPNVRCYKTTVDSVDAFVIQVGDTATDFEMSEYVDLHQNGTVDMKIDVNKGVKYRKVLHFIQGTNLSSIPYHWSGVMIDDFEPAAQFDFERYAKRCREGAQ